MYTIGQFADLTGVSIRTLRYYEKINVFKPTYVNRSNNYRYYGYDKFSEIKKLKTLRKLDFPLEIIPKVLEHQNNVDLDSLLEDKRHELIEKKEDIESALSTLNEILQYGESALSSHFECGEIQIEEIPSRKIISIEDEFDINDLGDVSCKLFEKIYSYNCKLKGNMMRLFSSDSIPMKIKLFHEVDCCEDNPAIETLEGGRYASILFKGLYSELDNAYQKLEEFSGTSNCLFIEEYVNGLFPNKIDNLLNVKPLKNQNPYDFLTKVMVKI